MSLKIDSRPKPVPVKELGLAAGAMSVSSGTMGDEPFILIRMHDGPDDSHPTACHAVLSPDEAESIIGALRLAVTASRMQSTPIVPQAGGDPS